MKLSLSEVESLTEIKVYRERLGKYCVKVYANQFNQSNSKEAIYEWRNMRDALICARGISKMFNVPKELISIEQGIQ
ncbi:hypothetical protein [Paenibacillus agricola]|uniref:Uncharacterized protein n=1 Tax=Paenibacillus agricola TaxID=2716264 RepID=A0ABX0J986_9BACL|nr:hypothetical protein [Paenibacillus agricola]NHN30315.1 hypothetical protein [Paenibacillus agricola]